MPEGVASALKQHEAKRQEHIYEFIITEKHHCQLLKVIQKVFCEGMTTYLDMKPELLDRLFPQLDTLISIHFDFLRQLRERQDSTAVIPTIADILMNQFGREENAVKWKAAYGAFCSQHSDAVSIYKDILKTDRRFQEFVQQCSNNPLLRKMGIPECILTVTTRITKYPLLIEPLIKTAKERPEEQQRLRNCLHLVKSILVDVNGQVRDTGKCQFIHSNVLSPSTLPSLSMSGADLSLSFCHHYHGLVSLTFRHSHYKTMMTMKSEYLWRQ